GCRFRLLRIRRRPAWAFRRRRPGTGEGGRARGRRRGKHVDGFVDVALGGRAGDAVVGGEPAGPGPVAEPAQREERLAPSGELPAAGRGAAAAVLGGEQS